MVALKIIGWTFFTIPIIASLAVFIIGERTLKPFFGYLFIIGFVCLIFAYFS